MMDFDLLNDYAPPLDAFLAFAASNSQLSNDYPGLKVVLFFFVTALLN